MEAQSTGLGRAIHARRAELGLKRKELAERALLSYPYLSELENETKTPSAKALRQLAAALELSEADLLARADSIKTGAEHRLTQEAVQSSAPLGSATALYRLGGDHRHDGGRPGTAATASVDDLQLQRLADAVAATIRAELGEWARTALPSLIRNEVRRLLNDENMEFR